jgi:HK97 family phage major capsid protein
MNKSQLQSRLGEIATRMEGLVSAAEASAAGVLTAEQETEYGSLKTEAADIKGKLEAFQRTERVRAETASLRAEMGAPVQSITGPAPVANAGPVITRQHECIEDDPKRGFSCFGEFATRVMDAGPNPQNDRELVAQVAAGTGMSAGVSQSGGVLVPPAFSSSLWDGARMKSNSLLSMTDQVSLDSSVESIEFPAINETSRVDGSRWGGIRGYWKGELTQMTESKPDLKNITFSPQELYVLGYISDKLLRRAPQAATKILNDAMSDEIAFKVGDAVFEGDGLGKPRGFKVHPGTVSVAKETGQAAATILADNINKMYARLHPNWQDGAVWFINIDTLPALESMSAVVGTGGIPVYLPPGGLADAPNARLKGKPVYFLEYCSTLGTVGDIVYCNPKAYRTVSRGVVDNASSMHLKFDYAQTAFRLIFEVDGQPMLNSAITPFKGSNTLSPFVTLATRA